MYKLTYDYLYGSSRFAAGYEFLPPELALNTESQRFTLESQKETYFTFNAETTRNYTLETSGFANVSLSVYDECMRDCLAEYQSDTLEALLTKGQKYIVAVKNLSTSASGTVCMREGRVVTGNGITYTDLKRNESYYYKYIPNDFSGSYKLVGNTGDLDAVWYDRSFNVISDNIYSSVFLSKNEVYYIRITNKSVRAQSGSLEIECQTCSLKRTM